MTVHDHALFMNSLLTEADHDEIDEEIQIDPFVSGTNNRRSDREFSRMLDLIDNLPISDSGKDGQA